MMEMNRYSPLLTMITYQLCIAWPLRNSARQPQAITVNHSQSQVRVQTETRLEQGGHHRHSVLEVLLLMMQEAYCQMSAASMPPAERAELACTLVLHSRVRWRNLILSSDSIALHRKEAETKQRRSKAAYEKKQKLLLQKDGRLRKRLRA